MKRLAFTVCLALLAACGGDDDTSTTTASIEPKLSALQAQVFTSCAFSPSCHQSPTPKGGLALDGNPFAQLLNVEAMGAPGRVRVKPGDPDGSYLLEKISNAKPAAGERMPPNQPLSKAKIDAVRAWIAAGAKND